MTREKILARVVKRMLRNAKANTHGIYVTSCWVKDPSIKCGGYHAWVVANFSNNGFSARTKKIVQNLLPGLNKRLQRTMIAGRMEVCPVVLG